MHCPFPGCAFFFVCGIPLFMKNFLKEPLTHFLIIGALLFIVFEIFASSDPENEKTITITTDNIKMLEGNFARTWRRQPTQEELDGMIQDRVREEMAYHEALAMGLDKEDPYIKNRLRMKMELLIEDIAASITPTDDELAEYLEGNRENYREDMQIAFSHVFLSADRAQNTLDGDIVELLHRLEADKGEIRLENYGDSTMLPSTYQLTPLVLIERQFGKRFSDKIREMKEGSWLGPIQSSYGYHLVLIEEIRPAYDPPLSDIRVAVERDLMSERRRSVLDKMYDGLEDTYSVIIESRTESND